MNKQEEELFYLRVKWQVELDRDKDVQRGLKLDEELRRLNCDEGNNGHADA